MCGREHQDEVSGGVGGAVSAAAEARKAEVHSFRQRPRVRRRLSSRMADEGRNKTAASTGRRNTLAQTEESEFVLTSQRHSPWFTLHEKPGPWNHCQPSSNGNVKRLL